MSLERKKIPLDRLKDVPREPEYREGVRKASRVVLGIELASGSQTVFLAAKAGESLVAGNTGGAIAEGIMAGMTVIGTYSVDRKRQSYRDEINASLEAERLEAAGELGPLEPLPPLEEKRTKIDEIRLKIAKKFYE